MRQAAILAALALLLLVAACGKPAPPPPPPPAGFEWYTYYTDEYESGLESQYNCLPGYGIDVGGMGTCSIRMVPYTRYYRQAHTVLRPLDTNPEVNR